MELKPPPQESKSIIAIGYNATLREMYIQFSTGTYKYFDVSPSVHKKLMEAESIGRFVSKELSPNHEYVKLKKEE